MTNANDPNSPRSPHVPVFGEQPLNQPPYTSSLPPGTTEPSAASVFNVSDPNNLLAWLDTQMPGGLAQFLLALIQRGVCPCSGGSVTDLWEVTSGTLEPVATPDDFSVIAGVGGVGIDGQTDVGIHAVTGAMNISGGTNVHIAAGAQALLDGSDVGITAGTGDVNISSVLGNVKMASLPTVDPGVSGALWNNGGVLNISP